LDARINTIIEVEHVQPCYAHDMKGPWLLPLFKLREKNIIGMYLNELVMIEFLNNLTFTMGFYLTLVRKLVNYNEHFKVQDDIILASIST
jgi:hypothetical protein